MHLGCGGRLNTGATGVTVGPALRRFQHERVGTMLDCEVPARPVILQVSSISVPQFDWDSKEQVFARLQRAPKLVPREDARRKEKRGGKKAAANEDDGMDEGEDEGEGGGSEEEDNPFDNAPKGPKLSAKRLAAIGFVAKDDGKKKKAPTKKKAAASKKK